MKNKTITIGISVVFFFISSEYFSQSTSADNIPGGGKFLGFNGAQNLEFRTNNTTYMQLMQNGTSNINGFTINRSGFLGLSQDPTFFTAWQATPFSLLHLNGDNGGIALHNGYRDWMRYGITFTHNKDFMYVGPKRNGADDITDAVICWADNPGAGNGPDNLIFVFTEGDGTGSGASSMNGREIARMIAIGHTGIGTSWSNTFQPKRTLDVIRQENVPQFRITRQRNSNPALGVYTDFQTSTQGHLHILPRNQSNTRNVAIGFLSAITPTERLDVLGTARLRQMPDSLPHALITGFRPDTTVANDFVLHWIIHNRPIV